MWKSGPRILHPNVQRVEHYPRLGFNRDGVLTNCTEILEKLKNTIDWKLQKSSYTYRAKQKEQWPQGWNVCSLRLSKLKENLEEWRTKRLNGCLGFFVCLFFGETIFALCYSQKEENWRNLWNYVLNSLNLRMKWMVRTKNLSIVQRGRDWVKPHLQTNCQESTTMKTEFWRQLDHHKAYQQISRQKFCMLEGIVKLPKENFHHARIPNPVINKSVKKVIISHSWKSQVKDNKN